MNRCSWFIWWTNLCLVWTQDTTFWKKVPKQTQMCWDWLAWAKTKSAVRLLISNKTDECHDSWPWVHTWTGEVYCQSCNQQSQFPLKFAFVVSQEEQSRLKQYLEVLRLISQSSVPLSGETDWFMAGFPRQVWWNESSWTSDLTSYVHVSFSVICQLLTASCDIESFKTLWNQQGLKLLYCWHQMNRLFDILYYCYYYWIKD